MGSPLSVIPTRVRVFDRPGTLLGTFAGIDLQWSNGKDNGGLSFTAHTLEADYAFDVFDDSVGVVQMFLPDPDTAVPGWQVVGPPYLLSTTGTVIGAGETAAQTVQVTGVNALALLSEWQVLHGPDDAGAGTVNRRGPDTLYYGWVNGNVDSFAGAGAATVLDRADVLSTSPRKGKPTNWEVSAASWLSAAGGGGLALFDCGTASPLSTDLHRAAFAADEEFTVYVMAEGQGGIVAQGSSQETGYEYRVDWDEVLTASVQYHYYVAMTKVDSSGGDGLDALSFYVGKVGQNNRVDATDPTNILLHSGDGAAVLAQDKDDPRPGDTVGGLVKRFRNQNRLWMGTDSSAALVTLDFDETTDSAGVAWDDAGERSWAFGTPISQVLSDLGDIADFDMAYGKVLKAYQDKGTDLSATVLLEPAVDGGTVLSWTFRTTPITATRVTFKTEDGFGKKLDTDLETTVAPRSAYLETQQSSSIGDARRLGQRYINENGVVRKVYDGEWVAVPGVIPGYDFDWGDTVQGLNRVGDAHDVRCITWAMSRQGDGPVICSGEFQ